MISQLSELTFYTPRKPAPKKRAVLPSVVVADDHPVIGTLLSTFLSTSGGYRLVGVATNGRDALTLCRREKPDMLVVDLVMPELGGLEVLQALKAEGLPTRAVVFTSIETPSALHEAVVNGAYAYLSKSTPFQEVIACLDKVRAGEFVFTPEASDLLRRWMVDGEQGGMLSPTETVVLKQVALGESAKEISCNIDLSESGTYRLIERLKQKLKVQTLQELTLIAVRRGLVAL
jgi:DNA-binding NarL/FixJ family response regulator